MKMIAACILLFLAMATFTIKPTYAFWSNTSGQVSLATSTNITIGNWPRELDIDYQYDAGDEFIFEDEVWTVVDPSVVAGEGETRMLVVVPGEGLVLVAITQNGSGKTIVKFINN